MIAFTHLELYTEYSVHFGLCDPEAMLDLACQDQQKALAISDYLNLFAWVKFYQLARKKGIKPLCGVRIKLHDSACEYLLICAHQRGYECLLYYMTQSHLQGLKGAWKKSWLKRVQGLWVLLLPGSQEDDLEALAQALPSRLALIIHRTGAHHEARSNQVQYERSQRLGLPVVATHPICFAHPDDFEAHEVRVCIQSGTYMDDPERTKNFTHQQHWLTQAEMQQRFHDVPNALRNAQMIAEHASCALDLNAQHLPLIEPPHGLRQEDYLRMLASKGLEQRGALSPAHQERLDYEINVISAMGFSGYFLIVSDFIQWSKSQKIAVGPGRGSGAGSLVAYALGITDLDPLKYDLLFERFLNPERVSMPDFDIDFCMIDRDRVIHYVQERYGRDCVSQIITYGTMAAKAVVRDVGRVLGHPYGWADRLAKLIPFELGITLERALEQEPLLKTMYEEEEEVRIWLDLAKRLEGKVRNVGRHAGGVVIAPKSLWHYTPLYMDDPSSMPMTQFDKDDLESIGLIKFDFLGLRTLTLLQWTLENIKQNNIELDLAALPLDDPLVYQLLASGETAGIFQLESSGMQDLAMRLGPDCFEDLIAMIALYRPGPMEQAQDFIEGKKGRSPSYPHPLCEPILRPTYGIMIYQEQVMQIAQKVAGYSLGHADLLRRAMGKKKPEEMAAQRSIFIRGAQKQGLNEERAHELFNLIEKFAGYGFNKSHAAAYALLSFQTAYLKVHYPDAFMAAVLSSEIDHPEKILLYVREAQKMGISILPPCVMQSGVRFKVVAPRTLRYALAALKGLGSEMAEVITKNQTLHEIAHASEWIQHAHHKLRLSRKALESLIKAGAFDTLEPDRGSLFASLEQVIQRGDTSHPDLFSDLKAAQSILSVHAPWSKRQQVHMEYDSLGWYMSEHPTQHCEQEAEALGALSLSRLHQESQGWVNALIKNVRRSKTRKGTLACFWTIEDYKTSMEVSIFDASASNLRKFEEYKQPLLLRLQSRHIGESKRWILKNVISFEDMRRMHAPDIRIILPKNTWESHVETLKQLISKFPGPSKIFWRLDLEKQWSWEFGSVSVQDALLDELETLGCHYHLRYPTKLWDLKK